MPLMIIAFAFGTPSASAEGNSVMDVPAPPVGGNDLICHYYSESQASTIYNDASDFGWTSGALSLAFGLAGWTYASGILGASGLGVSTNLSPFDSAHFKGTGVRICHDGYKVSSGSPSTAYYDNVYYAYY